MGWSLADCETLTIHGRPAEQVIPFLAPSQNLLILTKDASSPSKVAHILRERGYGASQMTALAHMNGTDEARFDGTADAWSHAVPRLSHPLRCGASHRRGLRSCRARGYPDSAFASDGTMTKQEVRAITLAKLAPARGALLWDVGCGAGSVAIEWMRAARDARAIGVECRADRRAFAAQNAITLGAPALTLIDGTAPEALATLPAPRCGIHRWRIDPRGLCGRMGRPPSNPPTDDWWPTPSHWKARRCCCPCTRNTAGPDAHRR